MAEKQDGGKHIDILDASVFQTLNEELGCYHASIHSRRMMSAVGSEMLPKKLDCGLDEILVPTGEDLKLEVLRHSERLPGFLHGF